MFSEAAKCTESNQMRRIEKPEVGAQAVVHDFPNESATTKYSY